MKNKIDTKALREKILDLAMCGKLVPQDPNDEPASVLLENIKQEKEQLLKEKVIKKQKPLPPIEKEEEPFEIPSSWEWVRLGEVSNIVMGQSPKSEFINTDSNGIEFHQGKTYFSEKYIQNSYKYTMNGKKFANKNSILISMRAPVGDVNLTNRRLCIGRGLSTIKPFNDLIYTYYYLSTQKNNLLKQATGTTFKAITGDKLDTLLLPLPPIFEQKRIVSKIEELFVELDKIDKAQEIYDSAANKLRDKVLDCAMKGKLVPQDSNDEPASELLKRIEEEKENLIKNKVIKKQKTLPPIEKEEEPFNIPSSWKWVRLGEVSQLISDGTHKRPTYVNDGVPFISVKDITTKTLNFSNTKFISEEEHQFLSKRCKPQKNDILLSKVGTIGVPAIVNTNREFNIFVSVALVRFNQNFIDTKFLYYNIQSSYIQKQAHYSTRGIANKNWVIREIYATNITLPPLQEQQRIVSKIEEIFSYLEI